MSLLDRTEDDLATELKQQRGGHTHLRYPAGERMMRKVVGVRAHDLPRVYWLRLECFHETACHEDDLPSMGARVPCNFCREETK